MPILFPCGDYVKPIVQLDTTKPVSSVLGEIIVEVEPVEVEVEVELYEFGVCS